MELESALSNAGLTNNEIKVYLVLLELGSALAGEITKKSGINRTNVYDVLDRLIEKGIASYVIKSNRKYFEATAPTRIIKYLEDQEEKIKTKKQIIESILPELELKRKLSKEEQESSIYKGKKGIKSITEDILKTNKELFTFGAEGKFFDYFKHYAIQWHKRRNFNIKIIYHEKVRERKLKSSFPNVKMRFNSFIYETPVSTWIYDDKVAIIVWSSQPIATLIKSKSVARAYKEFFKILWNNSKE